MLPSMLKGAIETSQYRDLRFKAPKDKVEDDIHKSTTLYVGNLSFFTTEEQIYELFSRCGEIKRIIMGLDKFKRTPCGFCFVEYYTRADAQACVYYINGSRLDDRMIRVDWDAGFKEGRQYGRGKSGGQVRDEFRTDYDSGRGGYGKILTTVPPPAPGMPPMTGLKRPREGEMPPGLPPGPYPPMMPPFGMMIPGGAGGLLPPPAKRPRHDDWERHQQHHPHPHQQQQQQQQFHHRPPPQHQQHHHHNQHPSSSSSLPSSASSSSRSSNPRFRERHDHDSDEEDDA